MPPSRPFRFFLLFVGLILLVGAAGVAAVAPLRWRALVLIDKATGRLPDIEWSEMRWAMSRHNGVDLEKLATTHNPFLAIESPLRTEGDAKVGATLFLENCRPCHGDAGRGGPGGPNLYDRTYRQGRSDWALFRTITRGIPNTAMSARTMPREDVWRLVTYLQQTIVESGGGPAGADLRPIEPVTPANLRAAADDPSDWLTYSGSYSAQRHSRLHQINHTNISALRVEWVRQFATAAERAETTAIVRGSTMFATEPPNKVEALDAATGRVLWSYSYDLPAHLKLCCGQVNRGVAILENRIFVGTLDARLIALDAASGKLLWQTAVADNSKGYSITGAPLAVDDMIVTGVGGGEFGIRGFIDAYDAATGQRRWRFYTVPAPGEPGSESWSDDSLRTGGASTWLTGAFDPELRLVYWGVGNPSPNYNADARKGDNLYSNSVVALDVDSGKLRWYFQFTPHDAHDWDAVQIPILVDSIFDGSPRKLIAWANRNGFFYLLDRTNGKFLVGTPFVKQTWADGLDANGRPHVRPESMPNAKGSIVYPSLAGGTNWWSPTYDPNSELMYVPTLDLGGIFYLMGGRAANDDGFFLGGVDIKVPNEDMTPAVKAIEMKTGHVRWQYKRPPRRTIAEMGGLLSTDGRLVFGGDVDTFFACDADTGAELWKFPAGAQIASAPMTFELSGRQYVAVAAGRSIIVFALPK